MKKDRFLGMKVACWVLLTFTSNFVAGSVEELPIDIQKLSERVLTLKVADSPIIANRVVALKSKKGLVVIDTTKSPAIASVFRKAIEREFSSKDFIYVINTHGHGDHVSGNSIFPEAVIIGHERCPVDMKIIELMNSPRHKEFRSFFWQKDRVKEVAKLKELEANSVEARRQKSKIVQNDMMNRTPENYTPPAWTFNNRMTLDLGDLTIHLFYFGRAHSTSSILIHIPEEKLLMVGDVFHSRQMSAAMTQAAKWDVLLWLETLDSVLSDKSNIETVLGGHSLVMTAKDLEMRFDYTKDLWREISSAKTQGLDLEEVKARLPLERFSYILDHFKSQKEEDLKKRHEAYVKSFWDQITKTYAADVFVKTMKDREVDAAIEECLSLKRVKPKETVFSEWDFFGVMAEVILDGRNNDAERIMKMLSELSDSPERTWWYLGLFSLYFDKPAQAVEYFQNIYDLDPESSGAAHVARYIEYFKQK